MMRLVKRLFKIRPLWLAYTVSGVCSAIVVGKTDSLWYGLGINLAFLAVIILCEFEWDKKQ